MSVFGVLISKMPFMSGEMYVKLRNLEIRILLSGVNGLSLPCFNSV